MNARPTLSGTTSGHLDAVLDDLCAALVTLERVVEPLGGATNSSGDGSGSIAQATSFLRQAIAHLRTNNAWESSPLVFGFVLDEPGAYELWQGGLPRSRPREVSRDRCARHR
jgi:hypothetical protein